MQLQSIFINISLLNCSIPVVREKLNTKIYASQ